MGAESLDAVEYFYNRVYPAVRSKEPEAKLYVVGANPPDGLRALGERDRSVVVTGFVDDLRDYYSQAAVVVAPMRFVAGVQNKVLEAMAMQVPVVATTYANEGIKGRPGQEIVIADDPEEFASAVVSLLQSPEERRTIGRNARRFVRSNFSWAAASERVDLIAREVEASRGLAGPAQQAPPGMVSVGTLSGGGNAG
jgi:glycosyltransferase involved in cell wall biosynthesis